MTKLVLSRFRRAPFSREAVWLAGEPPEWTRQEVLEFPGSVDGPWARYVDLETVKAVGKPSGVQNALTPNPSPADGRGEPQSAALTPGPCPADGRGGQKPSSPGPSPSPPAVGTVRYPRIVPRDEECAAQLKKRTLTNLYNQRPTWLDLAHRKLDQAVFAAYGWDPGMSDEQLLEKLLALNLARAQAEAES